MSQSTISCRVLRCSRQDEMYLYLREDLAPDDIPAALRERLGHLTQVMELELHPQRKLARVDVEQVMLSLQKDGFFLQMPPAGQINPALHFGD